MGESKVANLGNSAIVDENIPLVIDEKSSRGSLASTYRLEISMHNSRSLRMKIAKSSGNFLQLDHH